MLGLSQVRLRIVHARTLETLESAIAHATALGDLEVARRAKGILSFALAFSGDFVESERVRGQIDRVSEDDSWHRYIGGADDTAAGYVAYYQNRLGDAERHLLRVIRNGSGPMSFASIGREYFALAVAAHGGSPLRGLADPAIDGIPETDAHGVPWSAYRLIAQVKLTDADGRSDRAIEMAHRFENVEHLPAVATLLADLHRRDGDEVRALQIIEQIRPHFRIPYIRAAALVTLALIQQRRGRTELAHQLLEQALGAAAPQSIARPFGDPDANLSALLTEHTRWGTAHQDFISKLSTMTVGEPASTRLSDREREILIQLRSDRTLEEIATALGISVNTTKTHLRSIYRKLDVTSRRDAVIAAF